MSLIYKLWMVAMALITVLGIAVRIGQIFITVSTRRRAYRESRMIDYTVNKARCITKKFSHLK